MPSALPILSKGNRRLGFCVVGYVPLPRSQRLIEDCQAIDGEGLSAGAGHRQ